MGHSQHICDSESGPGVSVCTRLPIWRWLVAYGANSANNTNSADKASFVNLRGEPQWGVMLPQHYQ